MSGWLIAGGLALWLWALVGIAAFCRGAGCLDDDTGDDHE